MSFPPQSSALRLRSLIQELDFADKSLKTDSSVEASVLRELREALDNVRLTAWTVHELQNARDTGKDPRAVISFLTGERLRRFRRMIDDFCADLQRDGFAWPSDSINDLQDSVSMLREHLALLTLRRRGRGTGDFR